ncbi:MAG: hypothetical protein HKN48_08550 [Flavobacteriaceae bacterium]|nr:hypothetical protein [Flavobacteriaceae bacterium]
MDSKWQKNLKRYDELVALNPKFERLGKTMPYTSANTHMFSLLNKDGEFGIRLSKESQEKFKEEHNTTIYKSYGATMRDYVLVPDEMFDDMELLSKYLEESYQYVMSLPAQPRKKK